jgi:hypothetical protein
LLKPYPLLHDIRAACERAYEPIERDMERARGAESHRLALVAPGKPSEARRDDQIADYERRIKPLLTASLDGNRIEPERIQSAPDGRHFARIAADLEQRKARNEQLAAAASAAATDPPGEAA